MRLYQTPNLLELLSGSVSIVTAPDPKDAKWRATNLITNLSRRTSGNNLEPLIDYVPNDATFESCFKTTQVEMAATSHKFVFTLDLSDKYFVHAILVV